MKPASNNMPITAIWWNFGPSKKQIMFEEETKRVHGQTKEGQTLEGQTLEEDKP